MASELSANIILPEDEPAAELYCASGRANLILVCEHASNFIPVALSGLGLAHDQKNSHAASDIGALELAKRLSDRLDAPLVASRVSRLVYDCNRPPNSADAFPVQSEQIKIPGNQNLSSKEKEVRILEVYLPFRSLLSRTIDAHSVPPAIVNIHSFTPFYFGQKRRVELGILHDSDNRLARKMLSAASRHTTLYTAINAPYDASDGVTHTLREHAITRGLHNAMIEIRNDLIDTTSSVAVVAEEISSLLRETVPVNVREVV